MSLNPLIRDLYRTALCALYELSVISKVPCFHFFINPCFSTGTRLNWPQKEAITCCKAFYNGVQLALMLGDLFSGLWHSERNSNSNLFSIFITKTCGKKMQGWEQKAAMLAAWRGSHPFCLASEKSAEHRLENIVHCKITVQYCTSVFKVDIEWINNKKRGKNKEQGIQKAVYNQSRKVYTC